MYAFFFYSKSFIDILKWISTVFYTLCCLFSFSILYNCLTSIPFWCRHCEHSQTHKLLFLLAVDCFGCVLEGIFLNLTWCGIKQILSLVFVLFAYFLFLINNKILWLEIHFFDISWFLIHILVFYSNFFKILFERC